MELRITPKALASAAIGSAIPMEAAAKAASMGSPYLLELYLARALKRMAMAAAGSEKKAEAQVARMLRNVHVEVEFS
jgi:hypothetical protein